jgi:hypothetical protein
MSIIVNVYEREVLLFDLIPFGFPTHINSSESLGSALEEDRRQIAVNPS